MESTEYTATVAVSTDVPIFYTPPAAEPDAFVLEPAPEAPLVIVGTLPAETMPLPDEAAIAASDVEAPPAPQWVYTGNGLGAWFGADGNNIDPGVYYQADPETHQPLQDLFTPQG